MPVAQHDMNVEEYLALPLQRWTNLIDGEVVVGEARILHQRTSGRIFLALSAWCSATPDRGEVTLPIDVLLDDRNVFAPDLLWYSGDRSLDALARPQPLPDIAVEVRSPSTWRYDVGVKKTRYEQYGLPELWLVDTAADVVLVFRRSAPAAPGFDVSLEVARGEALTSPLLPGFALTMDELFGAS